MARLGRRTPRPFAERRLQQFSVWPRCVVPQDQAPPHVVRSRPIPFPEQQQDPRRADLLAGVQDEMRALHAGPHAYAVPLALEAGLPSRPIQPMAPITPPLPISRLKKGRWSVEHFPVRADELES